VLEPTTDTERYFRAELAEVLDDEAIETCAYLVPFTNHRHFRLGQLAVGVRWRAAFVAITATRLIFVETRIPGGAPLLENHGIKAHDRRAIAGAGIIAEHVAGAGAGLLVLQLTSGAQLVYLVDRDLRHVSTQRDFFDRVTAWWPRTPAIDDADGLPQVARAIVRVPHDRRAKRLAILAGVGAGIAAILYKLLM
jgi:hypothetical protein